MTEEKEENLVKKVCSKYNLTSKELAEKLDIPKGTIGRWSASNKIPKTAEIALNLMLENKELKDKLTDINLFKKSLKEFIFENKF
jgi:DNA-binding transcriptional regulator YiaG